MIALSYTAQSEHNGYLLSIITLVVVRSKAHDVTHWSHCAESARGVNRVEFNAELCTLASKCFTVSLVVGAHSLLRMGAIWQVREHAEFIV